jgi:hypothetical protein
MSKERRKMQTEYRKDIRNRYLVINSETDDDDKDYRLNMIVENRIPHFAPCRTENVNGKGLLYYDITGKTDILSYLDMRQADEKFFSGLFAAVAEALESIQEYLLDPDGILLDPEYIYISTEPHGICFIYYPLNEKKFSEGCRILSEKLLGRIKQDDIQAVRLGYGFYKECAAGRITAQSLRDMSAGKMTDSEERSDKKEQGPIYDGREVFDDHKRGSESMVKEEAEDYSFLFPEKAENAGKSRSRGFLNKIFKVRERGRYIPGMKELPEYEENREETTFLNSGMQKENIKAWLMPDRDFPAGGVMLAEDRYIVGKKIAGADITLESKAVSRIHAKLIWQKGFYCIVDLSSKNGTRVNGVRIESGEKVSLKDGDRIVFADAGCIYKQFS